MGGWRMSRRRRFLRIGMQPGLPSVFISVLSAALAGLLVMGFGAVGADAAAPAARTFATLAVTPTTVPYTGGVVQLAATSTLATECTFVSQPAVAGLPETLPCSSGSASTNVSLPANTTPSNMVFTFRVIAVGTGTWTSGQIRVIVAAVPRPTGTITANPTALPDGGGSVTLTASTTFAQECVFSAKPPVAGLPVTLPCPGGSASTTVVLPADPHPLITKYYAFYLQAQGVTKWTPPPANVGVGGITGPGGGSFIQGYWTVASDGGVFTYGGAQFYGSMGSHPINQPVVGMASTPDGGGYWLVARDGGVFCFGDAQFYGSMGGHPINQPVVGMASTPDGGGYWLVAADGGVFAFGDAQYMGSMGSHGIAQPIVGIASDQASAGYWLVAADGGVFAFGGAPYLGSAGKTHLHAPMVGIAATPDGGGYWTDAIDGGIFAYGDANFYGSMGGLPLNLPMVGMTGTADGLGYLLVASDGGVFAFGDAQFYGSMGGKHLNKPMVGMAATLNG
jgi:hypothetical protein